MNTASIAFIGGGNMAGSLITGLLEHGYPCDKLCVSARRPESLHRYQQDFALATHTNNLKAVETADIILLAVKPHQIASLCQEIAPALKERNTLIISVAAGIPSEDIGQYFESRQAIIRAMPNTPSQIGCGTTVLFANQQVSSQDMGRAEPIFSAVGTVHWVNKESLMDPVTAMSGSGPAYVFKIVEAMEAAGIEQGLPPSLARKLSIETCLGAAQLMSKSECSPAELRQQVTSPNGTTAAGLSVLGDVDIDAIFKRVIGAATERARQLAQSTP